MPFGDHLRADKAVGFVPGKSFDQALMSVSAQGTVPIHTEKALIREKLFEQSFDLLSPHTERTNFWTAARGAAFGSFFHFSAVMANQQ